MRMDQEHGRIKTAGGVGWRWLLMMVGVAGLLGTAGCIPGGGPTPPPAGKGGTNGTTMAEAPYGIDVIQVGERITVIFSDMPNPPAPIEQLVRDDGTINLPFNQTIEAAGKKASQLQQEIRDRYLGRYFKRVSVTVRIQGRIIHVGGYVRAPGRYEYQGRMTVLDAIKVAQDFNEFARRSKVRVTRADGTEIIVDCKKALKDPSKDVPIYPGDDVYVPKKFW